MLTTLRVKKVSTPDLPNTKPVNLIKELIIHSRNEGDIILDPFVGSGIVPLVAQQLRRHFIGMEIDPRYCRIAEKKFK